MRVVLIAPAPASYIWRKKRAAFTLPPMALPLLAALSPPGVEVRLIDEAVQDVPVFESFAGTSGDTNIKEIAGLKDTVRGEKS